MDQKKRIVIVVIVVLLIIHSNSLLSNTKLEWYLPIKVENRQSWEEVLLTKIGEFGLKRKARPKIPAHLHTGVDTVNMRF